jgi:hypothetical protein
MLTGPPQILETVESGSTEFGKLPKAQQTITWEISTSLVSLVNDVALAAPEALAAITRDEYIMRHLFLLVAQPVVPPPVHQASLACLWSLSEDNKTFAELVVFGFDGQTLDVLRRLSTTWSDSAATACGILHNIVSAIGGSGGEDSRPKRLSDLSDASLVKPLADIVRSFGPGGSTDEGYRVLAPEQIQIALEVLASIGTELQAALSRGKGAAVEERNGVPAGGQSDDEEDDEEEAINIDDGDGEDDKDGKDEDGEMDDAPDAQNGGGGDDHEMAIDDILADIDMVAGDHSDDEEDKNTDIPLLNEFCRRAIPQLIRLATAQIPDEPEFDLVGHALSALNNISWSVSCLDFTDENNAAAAKTWRPAGRAVWDSVVTPVLGSDTADLELAAKITGLAWAIARTMHGELADTDAHRKFIALYQATKGIEAQQQSPPSADSAPPADPFQALGVKCIGVLGQLAMHPAPVAVNREIGIFLVTALRGLSAGTTPVADAVEALNQLMDVYADEAQPCDRAVFWADGFQAHLEEIRHPLKMAIKKVDKRANEELRARADEAVLNLGRFVQYKKKHRPEA